MVWVKVVHSFSNLYINFYTRRYYDIEYFYIFLKMKNLEQKYSLKFLMRGRQTIWWRGIKPHQIVLYFSFENVKTYFMQWFYLPQKSKTLIKQFDFF